MPTTRSVLVCAAVVLGIGASAAHAELPNMAEFTWNKVFITEDGDVREPSNPACCREYLHLAPRLCSQSCAGDETRIRYELGLTVDTSTNRPAEVWVGTQCDDETLLPMKCRPLSNSIADIDLLATSTEN